MAGSSDVNVLYSNQIFTVPCCGLLRPSEPVLHLGSHHLPPQWCPCSWRLSSSRRTRRCLGTPPPLLARASGHRRFFPISVGTRGHPIEKRLHFTANIMRRAYASGSYFFNCYDWVVYCRKQLNTLRDNGQNMILGFS